MSPESKQLILDKTKEVLLKMEELVKLVDEL